jgi:hypothetical protein
LRIVASVAKIATAFVVSHDFRTGEVDRGWHVIASKATEEALIILQFHVVW